MSFNCFIRLLLHIDNVTMGFILLFNILIKLETKIQKHFSTSLNGIRPRKWAPSLSTQN